MEERQRGRLLGTLAVVAVVVVAIAQSGGDKVEADTATTNMTAADIAQMEAARDKIRAATAEERRMESGGISSADVERLGRGRLLESLKDPDTASIRNAAAWQFEIGAWAYCGEVNAASSFGGKAGYRRFIAGPVRGQPIVIEGESMSFAEFDDAYRRMCRRYS